MIFNFFKKKSLFRKFFYYLFFSLVSVLIIISRRPDAITNPQFWAEDGAVWYANAYNIGALKPIFLAPAGHFETVPNVVAAIAQLFPLIYGPLIFNIVAIIIQLLPIILIISPRFNKFVPSLPIKLFLILIYLLMPNTSEVYINLSNSPWYLAVSASIVLLTEVSAKSLWNWFDGAILFLSGLSGPFSVFLLPVAFLRWYKLRSRPALRNFFIIIITGLTQLSAVFSVGGRVNLPSELSLRSFLTILSRQIIWGSLIGPNGYDWVLDKIPWYPLFFAITTFFGLAIIVYALLKAPDELKLFTLFAGLNFFASLIASSAVVTESKSTWEVLSEANGIRYWLIPMLAFMATLIWGARKTNPFVVRWIAIFFLSCMILFSIKNYRHSINYKYPSYIDFHYRDEVKTFLNLPKGEEMSIPINPSGWTMNLVRH